MALIEKIMENVRVLDNPWYNQGFEQNGTRASKPYRGSIWAGLGIGA